MNEADKQVLYALIDSFFEHLRHQARNDPKWYEETFFVPNWTHKLDYTITVKARQLACVVTALAIVLQGGVSYHTLQWVQKSLVESTLLFLNYLDQTLPGPIAGIIICEAYEGKYSIGLGRVRTNDFSFLEVHVAALNGSLSFEVPFSLPLFPYRYGAWGCKPMGFCSGDYRVSRLDGLYKILSEVRALTDENGAFPVVEGAKQKAAQVLLTELLRLKTA